MPNKRTTKLLFNKLLRQKTTLIPTTTTAILLPVLHTMWDGYPKGEEVRLVTRGNFCSCGQNENSMHTIAC